MTRSARCRRSTDRCNTTSGCSRPPADAGPRRRAALCELRGRGELGAVIAADLEGFPDQSIVLQQVIVDGDDVASRWTYRGTHTGEYYGIPPTGKTVASTFVAFDRVVDGKLVENWTVFDNYDLMRQLGILPDPEGAVG